MLAPSAHLLAAILMITRSSAGFRAEAPRLPWVEAGLCGSQVIRFRHVKVILSLVLVVNALAGIAPTERKVPKPGIREVQVPFASIKPLATIKIGGTANWLLVTENAAWVASTKPQP